MYDRILVPHAGTREGDDALNHAISIAKSFSSKIILLHVVEEIEQPPLFALSSSAREVLINDIRNANENIKKEMMPAMETRMNICKEHHVQSSIQIVIGSAAEEILNVINEKNIELVVMAKRRKLKGIKSLLSLGSVSRKIVENTSCPVLLIDVEN